MEAVSRKSKKPEPISSSRADAPSPVAILHALADLMVFKALSFDAFLKKLISLLNTVIPVDSCLIYFFDREKKVLTLCASKKTHKDLMGRITLEKGEGITGWVAEHRKTVVLAEKAYADERFKVFKELPEDRYEAFLSVPIIDREGVVGVINLQHRKPFSFSKDDVLLVEAIVKIIASAFEQVVLKRKVDDLEEKLQERKIVERAKGLLMKRDKMTEKKAYDMIRTEAMKKRKTMREIAEAIVLLYG
ncbi:MAG: ANTAR domain-containing protein [Patescibacteria group bacterium]|nr:ANTAR domain-containing protein [Patescibacteria group bacterium]